MSGFAWGRKTNSAEYVVLVAERSELLSKFPLGGGFMADNRNEIDVRLWPTAVSARGRGAMYIALSTAALLLVVAYRVAVG